MGNIADELEPPDGFDIQVIDSELTFQELREQAVEAMVGIGNEEDS